MKHNIVYKKTWCINYLVPVRLWQWCVIEEYQDMIAMGGDIAWVDKERVVFKSKDKAGCVDLLKKLEGIKK